MNEITTMSLTTVSGAVVATGIIVQFLKIFWRPSPSTLRQASAMIAAGLVIGATFVVNPDPVTWDLATSGVFAGITAGLAASKAYEVVTDGIGHQTAREDDAPGHP